MDAAVAKKKARASRLAGRKVRISPMLPILLAVFLWLDCSVYTLLGAAAAILHECAHLFAVALCRGRIDLVSLMPYGADISLGGPSLSYKKSLAVYLAGIGMNILLLFASFPFFPDARAVFFAASNASLFALNILPIKGLDGGEALYSALCLRYDPEKCGKILKVTTILCFFPLTAAAIIIVVRTGYNLSLLLVCAYLLINGAIERK